MNRFCLHMPSSDLESTSCPIKVQVVQLDGRCGCLGPAGLRHLSHLKPCFLLQYALLSGIHCTSRINFCFCDLVQLTLQSMALPPVSAKARNNIVALQSQVLNPSSRNMSEDCQEGSTTCHKGNRWENNERLFSYSFSEITAGLLQNVLSSFCSKCPNGERVIWFEVSPKAAEGDSGKGRWYFSFD